MTVSVLVVDDLIPNLKLLEAKLMSEYYDVITATDGFDALEKLKHHNIDIVLLDVMMPGMDGFVVCQKIKTNLNTMHIPVIMVTALSDVEDKIRGLEVGADEFLTKPVKDIELFTRIRSLARVKSLFDELRFENIVTTSFESSRSFDFQKNFQHSKILLIDDDLLQAKNIKNSLANLDYQIEIISSLDKLRASNFFVPDLIIISCEIDMIDPLRLWVEMRSKPQYRNSILMLFTEEENTDVVLKGIDIGASDYFTYPIDSSELQARIKTQLRKKYYQDYLRAELESNLDLSTKDHLTGLYNRRYFNIHLTQFLLEAGERGKSFCLMMLDIDNFKKINDSYGHVVGDKVIIAVSERLKSLFRITDLTARYGGEEFVIIVGNITVNEGKIIAERIRREIENLDITVAGQKIAITISIGLAQNKKNETVDGMISRADSALYKAKNLGRNKVVSEND